MSHQTHEADRHPKQDFQVERLAFFSDAVFAIAITLLVIEFRVPHITKESTYTEVWQEVVAMKFKFLALVVSFFIIANYWRQHHLLFKHIYNYNAKVIRYSIFILLPIIFFPFTTAFFYESLQNETVLIIPFRIFLLNNILANITMFALYWLVSKKHKDLSYTFSNEDRKEFEFKMLFTGIGFISAFCLSFISLQIGSYGLFPFLAFLSSINSLKEND